MIVSSVAGMGLHLPFSIFWIVSADMPLACLRSFLDHFSSALAARSCVGVGVIAISIRKNGWVGRCRRVTFSTASARAKTASLRSRFVHDKGRYRQHHPLSRVPTEAVANTRLHR